MKILTAKGCETARPDPAGARREIPDGGLPGLYFQVQPSGAKSWAVRYRHDGRPRKLTLGSYPLFSLHDARERAREVLREVADGADPAAARAAAKVDKAEAAATGRDLVRTHLAEYNKRHLSGLRTGKDALGFLERSAGAAWGDRRIQDIGKRDVVEVLDALVDRRSPIAANRTLAHLKTFFGWCVARGVLERSPADGVRPPVAERSRDRVLSDSEIRALWRACERIGEPFGPLYRLLLLSGQRLRECAEMTESEISADGTAWTILASRSKNGAAHVVPLSELAQATLAGVKRIHGPRGFIFTTSGTAPVSGFAKAKLRLDREMAAIVKEEHSRDAAPIPAFVVHDLRRTAASGMASLGLPPHIIEAVLNHRGGTISGVAAVYNRHDYQIEKRAALEAWAARVQEIVGDTPAATNVVSLR